MPVTNRAREDAVRVLTSIRRQFGYTEDGCLDTDKTLLREMAENYTRT